MFDPGMMNKRVSITLSADGSLFGTLPEVWGGISAGLKNSADLLSLFENDGKTLVGTGNTDLVGLVTNDGVSIVSIADLTTGLLVKQDALNTSYFYKSYGTINLATALKLSAVSMGLVNILEKYMADIDTVSETRSLYDWGFDNTLIEDTTVAKSGAITGVTITRAIGTPGQYTLAFTKATNTLSFGGGVPQVAFIIPTTPTPYKMSLVASDLTTKIDVIVTPSSFPSGDATDNVGIAVAGNTSVDQPINVTGVTLVKPAGVVTTNTLGFTKSSNTLVWGGGTGVVISAGGYFLLTDTAGNTVVALVDPTKLPTGNKSDAGLVVHRCLVNNTVNDLMINLLS